MSTTPTANTLLPPAVRVAKIIGTLGSAYAAGAYLTNANHFLPALINSTSTPRDLALALSSVRSRTSKPLLAVTGVSSTAFAYIAYYLYSTPHLVVPVASITLQPGSFLPHTQSQELIIGAGWEIYAAATGTLMSVLSWQVLGVGRVERRIEAAGEGVRAAEMKGLKTKVVEKEIVMGDAQKWRRGMTVSGALVGLGAVIGGWAVAWL